jgi:5-methylcytosine-specific restriction endonuclease McrA
MREPPFAIPVPEDRYFKADHCANCTEPLPEDEEALFCSSLCAEIASTVRYQRRVFRDGRFERPDVQQALRTRNAFLLVGGYRSLARNLSVMTRAEVKSRDGGRCRVCGKPGVEIDHIDGSSGDLENLQLLCLGCHRAKTAKNLVPASTESRALLQALFLARVAPDAPRLLADDQVEWVKVWRGLKADRKKRFVDHLTGLGIDVRDLKSRAEMVLELDDFLTDGAGDSGPVDYDGGFGPDSYFAAEMRRDP